jgi:hypothetical protein
VPQQWGALTESSFGSEPRTSPSNITDGPELRGSLPDKDTDWVLENWRRVNSQYKDDYRPPRAVKDALEDAAWDDSHDIHESLRSCPDENRAACEAAWKAFHGGWAELRAIEVAEQALKRERHARRSSKSTLNDVERRTSDTVRKLRTRKSKSTGKRKRRPSREYIAFQQWCDQNEPRYRDASTRQELKRALGEIKKALDDAKMGARRA